MVFLTMALAGPLYGEGPDFSAGFEKLQALGLPDLKGAAWVRESGDGRGYRDMGGYYLQQVFQNSSGNAWQLAQGGQVIGAGELTARAPQGEVGQGQKKGFLEALGNAFSGKSSKVDPAADAQALVNALSKPDDYTVKSLREDQQSLGRLFLLAAQFHAAGHKAEANAVAAAVFALPADPATVLDSALSTLANEQTRAALEEFYQNGDWQGLTVKLEAIAARFTRGWARREAIAELAARIRTQTAKGAPLPPSPLEPVPEALSKDVLSWLAGAEKKTEAAADAESEETEETADEEMEEEEESEVPALWLLPATENDEPPEPEFLRNGVKTLAVLIPLLTDRTLVAQPLPPAPQENEMERVMSFDGAPKPLADTFRLPATRADAVAPLLRQVIPNSSEMDSTALHTAANAFWKDHAKKPPVELAALYLREGDEEQQFAAGLWLAQTEATGAEEAFGEWASVPEQVVERLSISREYIRQRREAAAGVVEKVAVALRARVGKPIPASGPQDPFFSPSPEQAKPLDKEQAEGVIRALQMLTSTKGLEDALLRLAQDAEPAGPVLAAMSEEIYSTPAEKLIPAVLKAAAAATPANRPDVLDTAMNVLTRRDRYERYEEGPPQAPPKVDDSVNEPLLALLENQEPIPPDKRSAYGFATIGDTTAFIEARLRDAEAFKKVSELHQLTGRPAMGFLRERALARLKKQPLPDWPDAKKVPAERLTEIVNSLKDQPPPEIIKRLESLTLEERAAFVAWLKKGKDPAPPDSLKAMRAVIHNTEPASMYGPMFGTKTAETGAAAGFKQGTVISPAFIEERVKALLATAKDQPPLVVMFTQPGTLALGWDLVAFTGDPKAEPAGDGNRITESSPGKVPLKSLRAYFNAASTAFTADDKATAAATLWIYGNRESSTTTWLLQPGGGVTTAEDENSQKPALETLAEILKSDAAEGSRSLLVTVITREQAKTFTQDSAE